MLAVEIFFIAIHACCHWLMPDIARCRLFYWRHAWRHAFTLPPPTPASARHAAERHIYFHYFDILFCWCRHCLFFICAAFMIFFVITMIIVDIYFLSLWYDDARCPLFRSLFHFFPFRDYAAVARHFHAMMPSCCFIFRYADIADAIIDVAHDTPAATTIIVFADGVIFRLFHADIAAICLLRHFSVWCRFSPDTDAIIYYFTLFRHFHNIAIRPVFTIIFAAAHRHFMLTWEWEKEKEEREKKKKGRSIFWCRHYRRPTPMFACWRLSIIHFIFTRHYFRWRLRYADAIIYLRPTLLFDAIWVMSSERVFA